MLQIAKQPILDKEGRVFAYELLNRGGGENPTQEILYLLVNDMEFKERLGEKQIFVNVDRDTLDGESLSLLAPRNLVLEILENVDVEQVSNKLWRLKEEGYRLALDDYVCTQENFRRYELYLPLFDIIKFDVKESYDRARLKSQIERLKEFGFLLLAEKVESADEFVEFKKMGFDFFQGYFFARPVVAKEKEPDKAKLQVLEIISLLESDSDMDKIVEAFKKDTKLTIDLLKYINSPFFGLQQEVSSVRFAINLIGPKRLKNWLYLMLYAAGDKDPESNPLYQLVQSRAKFMAEVARSAGKDEEKAFLVGVLSAADVLFKMPMPQIVQKMRIDKEVVEALVHKKNFYGKLLGLVIANEIGNEAAIKAYTQELGLLPQVVAQASMKAL